MDQQIIGMHDWLGMAPGAYMLAWMQQQADEAVADVFGYHAMQVGLPELDGLRNNRMSTRWLAVASEQDAAVAAKLERRAALVCDSVALPIESASMDLLVLPLSLDLSADPHLTLREIDRVLMPEGKVLIFGLNPASLWGLRQQRAHLYRRMGLGQLYLPREGEFIAYWRIRDWLRLLGFEVESSDFGCYRPSLRTQTWLQRYAWMDKLGAHSWPIFGAVYAIMAVKRVKGGMRLLEPGWKHRRVLGKKAVPAVNSVRRGGKPPSSASGL